MGQRSPRAGQRPIVPSGAEKEAYVKTVFNSIARYYDAMNRVMSLGLLGAWHRRFQAACDFTPGQRVLDVACGTGDLAILAARATAPDGQVVGIDLSEGMLEHARRRMAALPEGRRIELRLGNAQALPFPEASFDRVTTGFALRNFSDLPLALSEMARVLKPGGRLVALEISRPQHWFFRAGFLTYFNYAVPLLDWLVEGLLTRRWPTVRAYRYLPASLRVHPDQDKLAKMFEEAGLERVRYQPLTTGVVTIHMGEKPRTGGTD